MIERMLVLHGWWTGAGRLALWAEDSELPAVPPPRRGRRPRVQDHPFAADPQTLRELLVRSAWPAPDGPEPAGPEPAGPGPMVNEPELGVAGDAVLPVPTVAAGPLASPELVRDAPPEPDEPEVASAEPGRTARAEPTQAELVAGAWRVPVLELDPDAALDLLLALGRGSLDGDPDRLTVPGASLRHLAAVAGFADDLASRGRVLPGVRSVGPPHSATPGRAEPPPARAGTPASRTDRSPSGTGRSPSGTGRSPSGADRRAEAVWYPVVTGRDAAWARSLALALPPAGLGPAPLDGPPSSRPAPASASLPPRLGPAPADGPRSSREVLASALDALVDAAVRARLGPRPGARLRSRPPGTATGAGAGARPALGPAVGDRWRAALLGRQRAFEAGPQEYATLVTDLAQWHRDAIGAGIRARFRLVEPAEPEPLEDGGAADLDAGPQLRVTGHTDAVAEGPIATGTDAVVEPRIGPRARALTGARVAAELGAARAVDGQASRWRLELGLQAADDPGLAVDADRIWRSRGRLRALARVLDAPQETLLAELGRAARLYPDLTAALRTARPAVLELDPAGAHRFLRDAAPVLAAAGFGVQLPSWWGRPSARLGARLRASTPSQPGLVEGSAGFGRDSLVQFEWQLAIGDEPLTEAELRALVEAQAPLVRVRGQWVELDPQRLASGLKLLAQDGRGRMTLGELLQVVAGDESPGGLPVVDVTADGWLGELLAASEEQRLAPVAVPESFRGVLRPYQARGLAWLAFLDRLGVGGILADDMGLGKTVQLLALLAADAPSEPGAAHDSEPGPGPGPGPTLLVCPMSLVGNWQREAARFTPQLRVHVHHGSERPRGKAFHAAVAGSDLVVTTYALAARDAAALGEVRWRRIVLDEAQAVKNAATRAAAAVRSLPAAHRIAVTGTPVENRLADLWSIMDFANPGLLGGATAFRQRFALPIERHADPEATERLRRLTQPFILRRVKTDRSIISDLPEKLEMDVLCTLTREQAGLYQSVVDDMLDRIAHSDGMERRGLVLATMTKLKQVCNHPAQFLRDGSRLAGRSGKLQRLEETLEEVLAADEKALLFTQYAEFGGLLRKHLSARFGREVVFLHGGVPKAERDAMVERFQTGGPAAAPLFVLSLKAGGTGLTLTAANHVIHVDRWWNPAVEDQATDRAFRIGQTRAVQVRKLVCAGTVEEKISAMIRDKRGLAARIVGTGEGWLTELSTDQLRDLIRLEAGSVVE